MSSDKRNPATSPESVYWRRRGLRARDVKSTLNEKRLHVHSLCEAGSSPFREVLKNWGFAIGREESSDLTILLVTTYHDGRIDTVARQCAREGRPWLLFKPVGLEAWIGPLFNPNRGCPECLRASLRLQDPVASFLEMRQAGTPASYPPAYTPATFRIACHRAASELANHFLGNESAAIDDHVLTFDLTNWTSEVHGYVRRPHCPTCGNPRPGNPARLPFPSPPSLDLTRRQVDDPSRHGSSPRIL